VVTPKNVQGQPPRARAHPYDTAQTMLLLNINTVLLKPETRISRSRHTYHFQALVGASFDAQSVTGGGFVLFVQQRGVSGGLFVTALVDLATQKYAAHARRFCGRRGLRLGAARRRTQKLLWFYGRRHVVQHFVVLLDRGRRSWCAAVGLIGETVKRLRYCYVNMMSKSEVGT